MAKVAPTGSHGGKVDTMPMDDSAALQRLKIWSKLRAGELHAITKQDVHDLVNQLDVEERGEISVDELLVLKTIPDLHIAEEDIKALVNDCDKDKSGKVSAEELYKALTQGDFAFGMTKDFLNKKSTAVKTNECKRDAHIEWLHKEYDTDSALWSLPQTLMLFVAFITCMTIHLDVQTAYLMQSGLTGEIEGEGLPYLHSYVHDVETFWYWMETSFSSCHFKNNLDLWPYPGRVASYNQMIGGVTLKMKYSDPIPCEQSDSLRRAYDTAHGGWCHKSGGQETSEFLVYHERIEGLLQRIGNLSKKNWIDQNTTSLDIGILFYNAHLQAFTASHLEFQFNPEGAVRIVFNMETFLADPYSNILWVIPDIIFGMILVKMFYSELKELIPACLNGLDGFIAYMEFWNVIDWLCIAMGFAVMTVWGMVVVVVGGALQELLLKLPTAELDEKIFQHRRFLYADELENVTSYDHIHGTLEEIHASMDKVAYTHEWLRILVFIYSFILMMKFFKAFRANPRLNIVIQTVKVASVDIVHFGIVFFIIFFVFSSAAYVMFGGKIKSFSTQTRSMIMCWRILMGEFDVETMEVTVLNPWIAYVWIVVFQIVVLLILLNMLLAIIMDTYAAVKTGKQDPITIWRQIREAIKQVRETRGHLDLWYLICEFEDDDYPAHPGQNITAKSLKKAFERDKMTRHNAEYNVKRTAEYLKEKAGECELTITDSIRIIGLVKTLSMKISESTEQTLEMLKEDRRRPQEARFDAIMAGRDPDSMSPMPSTQGNERRMSGGYTDQFPRRGSIQSNGPNMLALEDTTHMSGFHGADFGAGAGGPAGGRAMSAMTGAMTTNGFGATGQSWAINPHGAGGSQALAGAAGDQVVSRLAQMQALLEAVSNDQHALMEELRTLRENATGRDEWLDTKLNALERRCEKVERASERVSSAVQVFDMDTLLERQQEIVEKALQRDSEGSMSPKHHGAGAQTSGSKKISQQIEALGEQVGQLLAHAEESADNRKLLWKVDLGLRQLRTELANGKADTQGAQSMSASVGGLSPPAPAGNTNMRLPSVPRSAETARSGPMTATGQGIVADRRR